MGKIEHPAWKVLLVSVFYMVFSILVVVLNKQCFDMGRQFPFPLTTTWFQMVVALICTVIVDLVQKILGWNYLPALEFKVKDAIRVIPVSAAFIAMIATGNMCLSYLQISFFQTAKSLHIIFSLLLSFFLFRESHSFQVTTWAVMVTVGWVISTSAEPSSVFAWSGLLWGVASSFMVALYPIILHRVIANLDKWLVSFYNAFLAILLLIPVVFFSSEWPDVVKSEAYGSGSFWQLMMVTAVAGFLLNFAAMANVHYSSPLSHMIAGSCKGVVQSLIAWAFFGNEITALGAFGSLVCILSIFGYTYVRYLEQQKKQKTK